MIELNKITLEEARELFEKKDIIVILENGHPVEISRPYFRPFSSR